MAEWICKIIFQNLKIKHRLYQYVVILYFKGFIVFLFPVSEEKIGVESYKNQLPIHGKLSENIST